MSDVQPMVVVLETTEFGGVDRHLQNQMIAQRYAGRSLHSWNFTPTGEIMAVFVPCE